MADPLDILRQYMAKQNPLGTFAAQNAATDPTINPAPPMAPMGPAPSLNSHAPVVPGGSFTSALMDPIGAAKAASQTPQGSAALLATALDPAGTIKAGGVNMDELKQGMANVATRDKMAAATADQDRLKAAGLAAQEDAAAGPGRAPTMPGPTVIPGGWVSTRDPETAAMFRNAQEQGMRAVDNTDEKFAAREASLDQREAQYKMAQAYADEAAKQKAQYDAQTDDANNKAAAAQRTDEEWRAVQNDLQSSKVDPNRYWSNMGAGNKVTSIFGALLGGFAQGFGRTGSNQFMDMLNHEIDKDVAQQEAQVAKKKDYAANLYGRFLQQTGDADKARALARATLAEVSKMTLASKEKLAQDDVAKAQLAQTLGALDARKQDELAAVSLRNAQINQAGMAYRAPQVVGGGGAAADKDHNLIFEAPNGLRYKAPDAGTRTKLADQSAAIQELEMIADKMEGLGAERILPGSKAYDDAKGLRDSAMMATKKVEDLGAITKADQELSSGLSKDPTSLGSFFGRSAAEQLRGYAERKRAAYLKSLQSNAVEQVQTGYKVTPQGQLAPAAAFTGKSPTKTNMPGSFKPVGK